MTRLYYKNLYLSLEFIRKLCCGRFASHDFPRARNLELSSCSGYGRPNAVSHGGGKKPGGESPRVRAQLAKEQGVAVVHCNVRSGTARSVFFSSFFSSPRTLRDLSQRSLAWCNISAVRSRTDIVVGDIKLKWHPDDGGDDPTRDQWSVLSN